MAHKERHLKNLNSPDQSNTAGSIVFTGARGGSRWVCGNLCKQENTLGLYSMFPILAPALSTKMSGSMWDGFSQNLTVFASGTLDLHHFLLCWHCFIHLFTKHLLTGLVLADMDMI
jgi:hypothetical protein